MFRRRLRLFIAGAAAGLTALALTAALAETRTWTDSSGKFEVEAELVGVDKDAVRLRNREGKTIAVPLKRLSDADRDYLRSLEQEEESEDSADTTQLKELAERFFLDLKTAERADAQSLLTPKARKLAEENKSPLAGLPSPDEHRRAVNVRDPEVLNDWANVPVRVRAGGTRVSTTLHFLRAEGEWRVAAISAQLPTGEATIDFEIAPGKEKDVDPLKTLVGKPLPLEGVTLDGQRFNINQYRGKVVLVDFWATWCVPCRKEIPNILANYEAYHAEGFEVVAVSTDRDLDTLSEFVATEQPPWVVLADRHPRNRERMAARYGIRSIPSLVLVDADGKVAAVHTRGKRLGEALEKLMGTPGG